MFDFSKFVLLLLVSASLLLVSGCGDSKASPRKEEKDSAASVVRNVKVARVEAGKVSDTVSATGSLAAQDRAVLSAKVPGRLQEVLVDLGSNVEAGAILARIEKTDYLLRKEQGEAALNESAALYKEAQRNLERVKKLRTQGIVPEAEIETVQAAFDVAQTRVEQRTAELHQAEQQLKDTEIRAPFKGVVEQRQAGLGEFLSTGAPVLTVVRVDPIRLRLEIAEADAARIRSGQAVRLKEENFGKLATGKLDRISPVISPLNRMLMVEADLPNPDGLLRPGSFVEAEVVVNQARETLVIPAEAVFTFAGLEKVVLVEQGKAQEASIRTGRREGDKVEVLSGLKSGQVVVLNPGNLRTGQPVAVN